jgi:hypothetical protein
MERIVAGLLPGMVCLVPAEVPRCSTLGRIHQMNVRQGRDPRDYGSQPIALRHAAARAWR